MSAPLRTWPSFYGLTMDIITQGREQRQWEPVDVGVGYNSRDHTLPRYIVGMVPSEADRLEATPMVTVETLARSFAEAERLAYEVDDIFMGYPLSTSSGGRVVLVDEVVTIELPVSMDLEEDTATRRFLATYQLRIRRG